MFSFLELPPACLGSHMPLPILEIRIADVCHSFDKQIAGVLVWLLGFICCDLVLSPFCVIVCCSALLSACERDLDQALQFVDEMHAAGVCHAPETYAKLIERCAHPPLYGVIFLPYNLIS